MRGTDGGGTAQTRQARPRSLPESAFLAMRFNVIIRPLIALVQAVGYDPLPLTHPDHKQARSSGWPRARAAHLLKNPVCCVSGLKADLDVHHVVPFHVDPSKELDPANLRTVSRPFHLLFGHCGDWQSWNEAFDEMVRTFRRDLAKNRRGRGKASIFLPAVYPPEE